MPESRTLQIRRCEDCGSCEAGERVLCHGCGGSRWAALEVEGKGTLISWTVVRRPSTAFRHLGVIPIGVIRLDAGAVVTGRLDIPPEAKPQIGTSVLLADVAEGVPVFTG